MNKEGEIYLVNAFEMDGDGSCDYIAGYCLTKEEAIKECNRLRDEQEKKLDKWNNQCVNCETNCDSFETADCSEAVKTLEKVRKMDCPYAKECEIREIKYGDDDESGGFEVCCDHRVSIVGEYTFMMSPCQLIKGDK